MINWTVDNVNRALDRCLMLLRNPDNVREIAPRGLRTLEFREPVCTTYRKPWQRVLLHPARDANPFFHLIEALWILAGREDVATLARYNSNIAGFSDNGVTFHAAYGYRLRRLWGLDQVAWAIRKLQDDPDTRQVVLQIWDRTYDMQVRSKDIPCNTQVYLKIRAGRLNVLVMCRSNDALWGAYGANAVQFSILQEYIAAHVGCLMGEYRQVSDSLHVYLDQGPYQLIRNDEVHDPYVNGSLPYFPLVRDPHQFDRELDAALGDPNVLLTEPFFTNVLRPMQTCWEYHKQCGEGLRHVEQIAALDWRMACAQWLTKREVK